MRISILSVLLVFISLPTAYAQEYALEAVAGGFENPVLAVAAKGDARLFVVQQNGVISVIEGGQTRDVLDIRGRVTYGGEAGLLGLALHPDFLRNGLAYVSFTTGDLTSVIEEYRYDPAAARFDTGSRRLVYSLEQPAGNHNGGMVTFGADGYLYAGYGDGGGANDTYSNGQNPDSELGTIIRIDVANDGVAAPADNPRLDSPAPFAWVYGLRNPWRFSIDEGLVYIADVGQSGQEEISIIPAGQGGSGLNLGWPLAEGDQCLADPACKEKDLVWPVATYPTGFGCAVTGGYVYRGKALPALYGTYFYGDFCNGEIYSFRYENGEAVEAREWVGELGRVEQLSGFGLDGYGELYVVSLAGTVFKLIQAE